MVANRYIYIKCQTGGILTLITRTPDYIDGFAAGKNNDVGPTIVLIADGWSRSVFLDALSDGDLPDIQEHLVDHGGLLPKLVSNIPSVSIASHASILTSTYQDEHAIPGHRWYDTASGECHDYLRLRGPAKVNEHLSRDVKTVFEANASRRTTISVQGIIRRGADVHSTVPSLRSDRILQRLGQLVVETPDSVSVAWLPRGDALSHVHGPYSRQVRKDMIETSRAIGKFARALHEKGYLERSQILLIPDHGHRSVRSATSLERVLETAGVRATINPTRRRASNDVVMTSGDSAAYLYLRDSTVPTIEISRRLVASRSVELVCSRGDDGTSALISALGTAVVSRLIGEVVRYEVIDGRDPLALTQPGMAVELDLSNPSGVDGPYPDFLHQYLRSHVPMRSSPILLFAAADTHFGRGPRVGWRMGFHRGTHGGPFSEEVVVAGAYRGDMLFDPSLPLRSADALRRLGIISAKRSSRLGVDEDVSPGR